jgi:putative transposase
MPNHVHLIAVPSNEKGLSLAIGETHRRYTKRIHNRENWQGHLWQERFSSFPMDEFHLLAATRYIEMNPVAAGLAKQPDEYRWSSARAHVRNRNDGLVTLNPLLDMEEDWREFLQLSSSSDSELFSKHERSGRPLGSDMFIENLEKNLGRSLRKKKPGPKKPFHNEQLSILSP